MLLKTYAGWEHAAVMGEAAGQTLGQSPSDEASQGVSGGHRLNEPRLDSCAAILRLAVLSKDTRAI